MAWGPINKEMLSNLMKNGWSWEGSGGSGCSSGGSSVQPDWNQNDPTAADYVKGRTHYIDRQVILEWDGNAEGKETIEAEGMTYVKISDTLPTAQELVGATMHVAGWKTFADTVGLQIPDKMVITEDMLEDNGSVISVLTIFPVLYIVYFNAAVPKATSSAAPTIGTYVLYVPAGTDIGNGVTFPETVYADLVEHRSTVPLPEEYIPDTIARVEDIPSAFSGDYNDLANKPLLPTVVELEGTFSGAYDGLIDGRDTFVYNAYDYYKIAEYTPTPDMVTSFAGTRANGRAASTIVEGTNARQYGLFVVINEAGTCNIPINGVDISFNAPSTGLYACYAEGNTAMTAGNYNFAHKVKTICTVNPSTLKLYAITVDDSGVIPTDEHINSLIDTKLSELAAQELSLPKSAGVVDHGTAGQFAVSDGMGGIMWKTLVEAEEVSY